MKIKSKDLFGQMKDMAAATIGFAQLGISTKFEHCITNKHWY